MKTSRKNLGVIISALFAIIMAIVFFATMHNHNTALREQQSEIDTLKSQIAILTSAYHNQKNDVMIETTGLDLQRTYEDDAVVVDFLELVFDWDSYDDYMDARARIMREYGIAEDSAFMSVFMPEIVNKQSPDGTNYNRIDTMGLNMTYEDLKSYVTGIVIDKYSYFSLVTVSSTWENGGEALAFVALTYTVDANGALSNIHAIPVTM